jgi:hypothetical protein
MLHARVASCWCTGWHTNTIVNDVDCCSFAVIYQCSLFYCLIVVCTRQVTNQGELVGGLQGLLLLLLLLRCSWQVKAACIGNPCVVPVQSLPWL